MTVSDLERSLEFYKAALAPLGIEYLIPFKGTDGNPDLHGFGEGKDFFFWLKQGTAYPEAIHWGFSAKSNAKVDEAFKAAIAGGAKERIAPRARVEFSPNYYGFDVLDPDGYSFEVTHKN